MFSILINYKRQPVLKGLAVVVWQIRFRLFSKYAIQYLTEYKTVCMIPGDKI